VRPKSLADYGEVERETNDIFIQAARNRARRCHVLNFRTAGIAKPRWRTSSPIAQGQFAANIRSRLGVPGTWRPC